ncbi:hypothetical protein ACN3ZE_001996 [Providencia rettgeri]
MMSSEPVDPNKREQQFCLPFLITGLSSGQLAVDITNNQYS